MELGAIAGGAAPRELACLRRFGEDAGAAFQIADDILDVTADRRLLGKTPSDRANGKLTYVSVYGLRRAGKDARALAARAAKTLSLVRRLKGPAAEALREFTDFVVERTR